MNAHPSFDGARLQAILAGDDDAFEAVVLEFQRPLFTFAWRYLHNSADAEEVTIEAFVRLHRARARLRADTNLSAWLFTALANLCRNRHRWRTRHRETSLDAPEAGSLSEPETTDTPPDVVLEHDEALGALRAAVDRLPHDQRTVVLLHHYEHLNYRDIGTIVGCSERGVETRLYRARLRLRTDLTSFLHEEIAT